MDFHLTVFSSLMSDYENSCNCKSLGSRACVCVDGVHSELKDIVGAEIITNTVLGVP